MTKLFPAIVAVLTALALPGAVGRQATVTKPLPRVYPHASATDVTAVDIDKVVKKTIALPVSDQNIKTIDVDGLYQVEVGVVHRLKQQQAGDQVGAGALEHLLITEVYQVVSGGGTFVTGGTLDDAAEIPEDGELAKTLTGRSSRGRLRPGTGRTRHVGPGDVIILPPNTAHVFTEVDEPGIVYMVTRVDPHHVLPKDYVNEALR